MLNVFITVSGCRRGFPDVIAVNRQHVSSVADFPKALMKTVEDFKSFADRLQPEHVLSAVKDNIVDCMLNLKHEWDGVSRVIVDQEDDGTPIVDKYGTCNQLIITVTAQDRI